MAEDATWMNADFAFDDSAAPVHTQTWEFGSIRSELATSKPAYTPLDEIIARNRDDVEGIEEEDWEEEAMETRPLTSFVNENVDSESDVDDDETLRKKDAYFAPKEDSEGMGKTSFADMNLSRPVLRGLAQVNYAEPTRIQSQAIPVGLLGRDICGGAVTGSGKTAAFVIPILERLLYRPKQDPAIRVVILCPTRELAIQCHGVASKLAAFTDIQFGLCVGGLNIRAQEAELRKRPDVVIATPGRLIDHVRNSRGFTLSDLEILVMDEADRMLEDGFKDELTEIIRQCPTKRQTMLFSATMTDNVDELIRLSLQRPVRIMVDTSKSTASGLVQEFIRIRAHREEDRSAYLLSLCTKSVRSRCVIFFRSKSAAHEMNIIFGLLGLKCRELHGNLSQDQRLESLEHFRDGKVDFLLCTDLASRGLDIKGVDTVINYDMPSAYTQYIHRIGRTARAGRTGLAISLAGEEDRKVLRSVLKHVPSELVRHRVIPPELLQQCRDRIESVKDKIPKVIAEEKEDRAIKQAEMEVRKAENLMKHKDEIASRPARTWFQTEEDKKRRKFGKSADNVESVELPKRILPPGAGMSRKKRRRMALREEDERAAKEVRSSIRSAKKNSKLASLSKDSAGQKADKAKGRKEGGRSPGFNFDLADRGNRNAGPKHK